MYKQHDSVCDLQKANLFQAKDAFAITQSIME